MLCVGLTYEVLLVWVANRCLLTPILQPSKGILVLRHAHNPNLIGGSGLRFRPSCCTSSPANLSNRGSRADGSTRASVTTSSTSTPRTPGRSTRAPGGPTTPRSDRLWRRSEEHTSEL